MKKTRQISVILTAILFAFFCMNANASINESFTFQGRNTGQHGQDGQDIKKPPSRFSRGTESPADRSNKKTRNPASRPGQGRGIRALPSHTYKR